MVDFKYYVVTITAIFAALFAGLILGSSLSTNEAVKVQQESLIKSIRSDLSKLRTELSSKQKEINELTEFVEKSEDWLVAEKLYGKTIYIISFSDVKKSTEDEVLRAVKYAGGEAVLITIDLESLHSRDSTLVSGLMELSYLPEASEEKISDLIAEKGKISGDISQAQEVVLLFDAKSFDLIRNDPDLKKFKTLRTATGKKELAENLFKEGIAENLVCTVLDGDIYDDSAFILSFYSAKGIFGEPGFTGIIPEKGD
jgi:hypothetical protein